jgi:hypothetical protein
MPLVRPIESTRGMSARLHCMIEDMRMRKLATFRRKTVLCDEDPITLAATIHYSSSGARSYTDTSIGDHELQASWTLEDGALE